MIFYYKRSFYFMLIMTIIDILVSLIIIILVVNNASLYDLLFFIIFFFGIIMYLIVYKSKKIAQKEINKVGTYLYDQCDTMKYYHALVDQKHRQLFVSKLWLFIMDINLANAMLLNGMFYESMKLIDDTYHRYQQSIETDYTFQANYLMTLCFQALILKDIDKFLKTFPLLRDTYLLLSYNKKNYSIFSQVTFSIFSSLYKCIEDKNEEHLKNIILVLNEDKQNYSKVYYNYLLLIAYQNLGDEEKGLYYQNELKKCEGNFFFMMKN